DHNALRRRDAGLAHQQNTAAALLLTRGRRQPTNPTSDPLDDLLTPDRFTNRNQVEDHLLDRILPAAYTPRPGQPTPRSTATPARAWLGYLATQMTQHRTRELAWWQIPTWLPTPPRTLTTALVYGLAVALAVGLACGLPVGLVAGLPVGLVAGLPVGL